MNFPKKKADHEIKALLKESPNLLVALEGQYEYKKFMGRLLCENDSNKPRAFFTPKTTDDVCRVLQYASANQHQVSLLGGGHDPKGILASQILKLGF